MTPPHPLSHVDATGARPVVAGTDIKVSQIASESVHQGMSPEEIVEAHPHLTLAQVHAALAYYHDFRDDIHRDWREAEEVIAAIRRAHPGRLRKLMP